MSISNEQYSNIRWTESLNDDLRLTVNTLIMRLNDIQTSAFWRLTKPIQGLEYRFPLLFRSAAFLSEILVASVRRNLFEYLHCRREVKSIYQSGLFDPIWYVQQYPAATLSGLDPALHYLMTGANAGYWPSAHFDPCLYLCAQSDSPTHYVNPLLEYIRGRSQLRQDLECTNSVLPIQPYLREKILESGLFDAEWYLANYPDVKETNRDPLFNYLTSGWREGRSPSRYFDGQLYLRSRPEVREKGINPLIHFIFYCDASDPSNEAFTKCPSARNAIAEMLVRTAPLDPQLSRFEINLDVNALDCYDGHSSGAIYEVWNRIFETLDRPYGRLICVSPSTGDFTELVAANIVRAVVDLYGDDSVLLFVTDFGNTHHFTSFPVGAQVLYLSDFAKVLTIDDQASIVELLIQALMPRSVLNIHSRACWEAIRRKGRALSSFCDLFVAVSDRTENSKGSDSAYIEPWIRDCLQSIKKMYFDDVRSMEELKIRFGIPPSLQQCLTVLRQPLIEIPEYGGFKRPVPGEPLHICWAGQRLTDDNISILSEILCKGKNILLDVYSTVDDPSVRELKKNPKRRDIPNLQILYKAIEDIYAPDYSAFLFTSLTEDRVNLIPELAAIGIPIITTDNAYGSELIDNDTGWKITDQKNPQNIINVLEQIHSHPEEVQRRVCNLRERVTALYSWATYLESLSASPSFLD